MTHHLLLVLALRIGTVIGITLSVLMFMPVVMPLERSAAFTAMTGPRPATGAVLAPGKAFGEIPSLGAVPPEYLTRHTYGNGPIQRQGEAHDTKTHP